MDGPDGSLLVIAGPTAVGKTAIGLAVAQALEGEIISADSQAVYRGLDIGTAKASLSDRERTPHHGIDLADPGSAFSVADFQNAMTQAIADIQRRDRLPIIVGGTGLWIRALVRGFHLPEEGRPSPLRGRLTRLGEQEGYDSLRRQLRVVDPDSYQAIGANDHRRLVRALEVFMTTGRVMIRHQSETSGFPVVYWVLTRSIQELRQRIQQRTERMIHEGLTDEVHELLRAGVSPHAQSLTAIGYRETVEWLYGRLTAVERDALITRHTNQLAKRQLTWFRAEKNARWLDLSAWPEEAAILKIVESMRS